jgi:HAD superfamily hydrolase (TIGR01509 family)
MIKFVYFDVGGVALQDFTGANHGEEIAKIIRFGKFGSLNDFWNSFLRTINKLLPQLYFVYIKNKNKRFAPNKSIWTIIEEINKISKIGLLTNMDEGLLDLINNSKLLPNIDWDVVVDSSDVGVEKPNPKIYKIAEEMSGFKGKEILFIDNTKQNVDAAIKFGWNGFLYDPTDCEDSSKKLLEYYKTL